MLSFWMNGRDSVISGECKDRQMIRGFIQNNPTAEIKLDRELVNMLSIIVCQSEKNM